MLLHTLLNSATIFFRGYCFIYSMKAGVTVSSSRNFFWSLGFEKIFEFVETARVCGFLIVERVLSIDVRGYCVKFQHHTFVLHFMLNQGDAL